MAKFKNNKTQKKITAIFFSVIIVLSLLISISPQLNLPIKVPTWDGLFAIIGDSKNIGLDTSELNVHFIDVGQGDCILIQHNNTVILIDSGENGNDEKVLGYLNSNRINEIDLVIVTHPHSDHIGSMDEIINGISVKRVLMNEFDESLIPTTKTYINLLNSIANSDAKLIKPENGQCIILDDLKLTIYIPLVEYGDYNNTSIVIRLDYKETSFLFTGDIEKDRENDMLNEGIDLSADVLKVAHHGSITSSTPNFIENVNPSIAVIMCGKNNQYSLPSTTILNRFLDYSIDIYRTDYSGTVIVSTNGTKIRVQEENAPL